MDLFKTKKSPARGWLLVLGALALVEGAVLLSSCKTEEEEPLPDEEPTKVVKGPKILTSPEDVEEALKGAITLVIDEKYKGTWEGLLKIIEDACKDVPGKTVELDLSATRLAVYGDVGKDGIYDGDHGYDPDEDGIYDYDYDNDGYDNDGYDNDGYAGVVVFDPRMPIHYMLYGRAVHDPYNTGEPYITKLTLPNVATTIADGGWDSREAPFAGFKGLVEVSADKVETIKPFAFSKTRKLEKAYFRAVKEIGQQAFELCPALAHLYFPGQPPALPVAGGQPNAIFQFKTPQNEGELIIHVPNGEAVDAYTGSWEVDEITDASSTTLFGGSDFLFHKRVVITAE
jgi:hypothetical protein